MRHLSHPVTLGMMVGLAAALQLGPVYWLGGGYVLSMLSTLPVAAGAALAPRKAPLLFAAGALVVGAFSTDELFVFLLMTGLLGVALGLTARRPTWRSALISAGTLAGGMLLLHPLVGIWPWGGVEQAWPTPVRLSAYAGFALAWAGLWCLLFRQIWRRVVKALG
ncbi:MAG: hypothetical protein ACM3XM_17285 [Mycobacterium leprae]